MNATLYSPNTAGADSSIRIRNSADTSQVLQAELGYGELHFGIPNVEHYFQITPQPTVATDVKFVLQGTTADFYYRTNGVVPWTYAGQKTGLGWSTSVYDEVMITSHGGVVGGIDSILLTSDVPEPTTLTLLGIGLIGLLAYAWRKRK